MIHILDYDLKVKRPNTDLHTPEGNLPYTYYGHAVILDVFQYRGDLHSFQENLRILQRKGVRGDVVIYDPQQGDIWCMQPEAFIGKYLLEDPGIAIQYGRAFLTNEEWVFRYVAPKEPVSEEPGVVGVDYA